MESSGGSKSGPASRQPAQERISTSTQFVFVDQTDNSPESRVLNRLRIRSQARSHAGKAFKEKHKTGQRRESTEVKTLVAQGSRYNDSGPPSYHSGCLPTSLDNSIFVGLDSNSYSYDLANGEPSLFPGDASSSEGIDPVVGSSTVAATNATWVSQSPGHSGNLEDCCYACGSKIDPISPRLPETEARMNVTSRQQLLGALPSPCGLLGAGRVDPFMVFPLESSDPDVHELIDLEATYVIPGLCPDDHPRHGPNAVNSVAKAWLSTAVNFPFYVNILLFAACIQREILRGSDIRIISAQALSYKVNAIRLLNEVLANGKQALTDQVILTILGLLGHEAIEFTEEKTKPFQSPLQSAGLLHIFGGLQHVSGHLQAIMNLFALRGGIEPITMPGLADCLILVEISSILNSSFVLNPVFPPLRYHEPYITEVKGWATSPLRSKHTLGTALSRLPGCSITPAMLGVLESMAAITMAIDHYLQGKPAGLTLGQIVRTRTGIQKLLLFLPPAKEDDRIVSSEKSSLYECCRLTALIFSVAVIFPIPNTYNVLQNLVRRLKAAIEVVHIASCEAEYWEIYLWILVIGGIAALGKPERDWFVTQLAFLGIGTLGLDWEGTEVVMRTFLWLDSACSSSGRLLWDEVVKISGLCLDHGKLRGRVAM